METNVILGAGVAGISAAYHLKQKGIDSTIYEAQNSWGGLIDNFSIDGFRFDKAVHFSFTKNSYVRSLFDQVPYYTYRPQPFFYDNGRWLKHPVQNNLYPLKAGERVAAIKSFLEKPEVTKAHNYYKWQVQKYGRYISDNFTAKYAEKYWTMPSKELTVDWVGNRMYQPRLEEVLYGALTDDTENVYYAGEMRYPQQGGYKSFIGPMVQELRVKYLMKAVSIDTEYKQVTFENGLKTNYENLISSLPLPEIVNIIKDVPSNIIAAAAKLQATSIALVSIGFSEAIENKMFWFYLNDSDLLPARAYSPSLKSADNVPDDCSSMQFEIYYSPAKPLKLKESQLCEHVVDLINKVGLAKSEVIDVKDCRKIEYANVIFDHNMNSCRGIVKKYLEEQGIITIGRFGEWDYLWSDQVVISGVNAASRIT
jgi:protoporphyrinogen oxidase